MGVVSRTSFSTGDIPSASEWNAQFDTIYNEFNGSIDADNLADSAVTQAKLASDAVVDVKVASGAAIDASKIGNGDVSNTELSLLNNSSDFASYTPTFGAGWGTCTNVNFYWARIGNILMVQGTFTSGTVVGAAGTISLPGSLSASSNYGSTSNTKVGDIWQDTSVGIFGVVSVAASSSTVDTSYYDRASDNNGLVGVTPSGWTASSRDFSIQFTIML